MVTLGGVSRKLEEMRLCRGMCVRFDIRQVIGNPASAASQMATLSIKGGLWGLPSSLDVGVKGGQALRSFPAFIQQVNSTILGLW